MIQKFLAEKYNFHTPEGKAWRLIGPLLSLHLTATQCRCLRTCIFQACGCAGPIKANKDLQQKASIMMCLTRSLRVTAFQVQYFQAHIQPFLGSWGYCEFDLCVCPTQTCSQLCPQSLSLPGYSHQQQFIVKQIFIFNPQNTESNCLPFPRQQGDLPTLLTVAALN